MDQPCAREDNDRLDLVLTAAPSAGSAGCHPTHPAFSNYSAVSEGGLTESRSLRNISPETSLGRRVVVTGMAGAGKSTFSRALSARTGLPVIHLDLHFWQPGWTEPSDDEWRDKQLGLLAGDEWIADGNYHATLELRLERADTVVFLDTPWWVCCRRAFVRGIRRRPVGFQLPNGCEESAMRRLHDEWWLVWRIWRVGRSERDLELRIVSRHESHVALHVVHSARATRDLLSAQVPQGRTGKGRRRAT
jgi:adenylate kinase family enzyme